MELTSYRGRPGNIEGHFHIGGLMDTVLSPRSIPLFKVFTVRTFYCICVLVVRDYII
jgi:hypothetical protein